MEKDTKQMVLFKDIFHKPVEIDFNGGDISSDICGQMPKNGKDLASQPTFSRLENAPSRKNLYRMA